jgi:hypothetical protein
MKTTIKKTVAAIALLAGILTLNVNARTFELTAWRGETLAAVVEDFAELAEAPEGISIKFGVMKPVKYAPSPLSLKRHEIYDRVVWEVNKEDCGPRVVEISVPQDAKPGVYKCGNMNIRVLDRVLPSAKDWKYFLDLWQHPWAISRIENVKPFSRSHFKKMRPIYELLSTAGQKTLTVTIVPQAWDHQCYDAYDTMIDRVKMNDGSWKFDYTLFDKYVEFGRSCGLGPTIACYTMCPWSYVCRYKNENGDIISVTCKPGTKEFEDYWGDFLVDFTRHLKEKGWFNDTYIAMDERTIEDVRAIGQFIQKHSPGMKVAMAGNHLPSQYGVTIDNFCMILSEKINADYIKEAVERRAKGMITTYYVCCVPIYPNTFMWSEAGEAFWLGAYPAMCGLDGFLRWAWNSWPKDPVKDASFGSWHAGDTFLCYPGGEPSWRFLELRNGIIAAEKIRILKEKNLFTKEIEEISKLYKEGEARNNKSNFVAIRRKTLKLVNKE